MVQATLFASQQFHLLNQLLLAKHKALVTACTLNIPFIYSPFVCRCCFCCCYVFFSSSFHRWLSLSLGVFTFQDRLVGAFFFSVFWHVCVSVYVLFLLFLMLFHSFTVVLLRQCSSFCISFSKRRKFTRVWFDELLSHLCIWCQ